MALQAMWFIFWLLRNSRDKFNQITSPAPTGWMWAWAGGGGGGLVYV